MVANLSYHFGPYRLLPYQRLLLLEGKHVPLDPQSFEVLHILVQNSGKVVRRSDLLEAAWDAHVEDGALAYQIYRLREALGDDPGHPTYIETLRGRGFRFKAPVERVAVNRSETLSEADRLYLKGRYLWHKSTAESVRKAIGYFERALEKDPEYVLAYTGVADAWVLLGSFGHQSVSALEAMPKAEAAAKQALTLDDSLAEAHAALASVKALFQWDWPGAEREFKYAVERSPDPMVRAWYALCLAARAEDERARGEIEKALEIDPTSPVLNAISGRIYYLARDYDAAVEQCRQSIELEGHFYLSYLFLGHALRVRREHSEALTAFDAAAKLIGNHPTLLAELGHEYAVVGESGKASGLLDELLKLRAAGGAYVSPYLVAHIYIGMGDEEMSLLWLEQTCTERGAYLIFLTSDPIYDVLRGNPQFEDLIKRVGFMR
jgi:DNA-binding winged helix-turn-helix (wHTH) protein/Flp pilus assembly protein TadD